MFDYAGNQCPYCSETFQKGDDVAVCPDCGTPHHRACYLEHKACANAEKHEADYDWRADNIHTQVSDTFSCPGCGNEIAAGTSVCESCGMDLAGQISPYAPTATPVARMNEPTQIPVSPFGNTFSQSAGTPTFHAKEFDGISVADWLKYIGNSAGYYLTFFQIQDDTGRKTSFTFSAALFPWLYFLYRKLWAFAALAFAITCLVYAPFSVLWLAENGIITGLNTTYWATIANIATYASLAVNLLWGLFAVRIYRNASAKRIRSIKVKSASEEEYQTRLSRVSGPSTTAVSVLFFMVMAVLTAYMLFL